MLFVVQHRRSIDLLAMGTRKPDAWTPLNRQELRAVQAEMQAASNKKLVQQYESLYDYAKLVGDGKYPPKPWVIQTLVQVWRELHKRFPKGR